MYQEEDAPSLIGKKVYREAHFNEEEKPRREYGIVVHTWWDDYMQDVDCYIAFHGEKWFEGDPIREKPYILRYYAYGLTFLD